MNQYSSASTSTAHQAPEMCDTNIRERPSTSSTMTQTDDILLPPPLEPVMTLGHYPPTSRDFSGLPGPQGFSPILGRGPYHELHPMRKAPVHFTADQRKILEEAFEKSIYLVSVEREEVCRATGLSKSQVQRWFYNRRTKEKRRLQKFFTEDSFGAALACLRGLMAQYPASSSADVNQHRETDRAEEMVNVDHDGSPEHSVLTTTTEELDETVDYARRNIENASVESVTIMPDMPPLITSEYDNIATFTNNVTLSGGGLISHDLDQFHHNRGPSSDNPLDRQYDLGYPIEPLLPPRIRDFPASYPNTVFDSDYPSAAISSSSTTTSGAFDCSLPSSSSSVYGYTSGQYSHALNYLPILPEAVPLSSYPATTSSAGGVGAVNNRPITYEDIVQQVALPSGLPTGNNDFFGPPIHHQSADSTSRAWLYPSFPSLTYSSRSGHLQIDDLFNYTR